MANEAPLSEREIELIQSLGLLQYKQEILDRAIQCLVVRCGGSVTLDYKELHFCQQQYTLETIMKTDDLTQDISFKCRLK